MGDPQPSVSGLAPMHGTHLYYEQAGAGTTLVCVHAGIADRRMWDDQWPAFAARPRVIRYDLRGFGRSGPHIGPFCHVDDLAGLFDHLGVDRVVLLGASLGGAIAIDFTLAYPGRVRTLFIAGLSGYWFSEQTGACWVQIGEAVEAVDQAGAVELELRMWVDGPGRTRDQYRMRYANECG